MLRGLLFRPGLKRFIVRCHRVQPAELRSLVKGVIWVLILAAILPTKADPDLWGNLRFGQDLLALQSFSTVDPYSFTQDKPWINHSWLPQVVMAWVYGLGGTAGLVALKVVLVAVTLWLVAGAYSGTAYLVRESAVAAVLVAALPLIATIRAQLWTFVAVGILCRMILSHKSWPIMWAPVLFAVWANSHVGWIIGMCVLIWWAIGCVIRGGSQERTRAIAITTGALLATLLNPYGWQLWQFSAGVAHLSRDISEWQPLWRGSLLNRVVFVACAAGVLLVAARTRPRVPFERIISIAGLGYASLQAVKFVHLFVEASVLLLAPAIASRYPRSSAEPVSTRNSVRLINAMMIAGLITFTTVSAWPQAECLASGEWHPDPTAARALKDAQVSGRIVVNFAWGEYVIWHFGPRLRVSFDPRFDLVYSERTIAEQLPVPYAGEPGLRFLDRARPEYVWFPQADQDLKRWLTGNGYRIDIDTAESFVAVREDVAPLRSPGPQTFGCFPA